MLDLTNAKECLPWLLTGGLGHLVFDVAWGAAVFAFGAKWQKNKHSRGGSAS